MFFDPRASLNKSICIIEGACERVKFATGTTVLVRNGYSVDSQQRCIVAVPDAP